MVDLWMLCRRHSGMGGKVLPGSGGIGDQPAALIDAFDVLDAAINGADHDG